MWALESLFALMGLCRVESLWQAKNAWVYLSLSYNINVSSVRTRISFPVCIAYLSKLQKISVDSMTLSYLSCLNITFINIVVLPWIFKRQTVPSLNNNEKFYEYLWRISLDTPFNVTIYNRKLPEILRNTHRGNIQLFSDNDWKMSLRLKSEKVLRRKSEISRSYLCSGGHY